MTLLASLHFIVEDSGGSYGLSSALTWLLILGAAGGVISVLVLIAMGNDLNRRMNVLEQGAREETSRRLAALEQRDQGVR